MSTESPPAEDNYADYRPQALTHPFSGAGMVDASAGRFNGRCCVSYPC